jgi:hypothetical protein
MLAKGTAGQVFPPPLVGGKTPEELKEWLKGLVGTDTYEMLLADHGEEAALDVAIAWFSRERLLSLLGGKIAPRDEEERVLVGAAEAGQPVSLLSTGLEDWDGDGVSPVLRKVDGGWTFALGDFTSEVFGDVVAAAQQYRVFADAMTA